MWSSLVAAGPEASVASTTLELSYSAVSPSCCFGLPPLPALLAASLVRPFVSCAVLRYRSSLLSWCALLLGLFVAAFALVFSLRPLPSCFSL